MTMRRLAFQASFAFWITNAAGNEPCTMQRNTTRANYMLGNPFGSGDEGRMQPRNQQMFFWHPGVVISNTLATVWIGYRDSVVRCARSQVRPFHDDDEAAHEHVTEHMRDVGERLLHEGDFSYEDISGQDEPTVGSPPAPGENTATGPDGEGQVYVDPEARRRIRGKTRPISLERGRERS